MMEKSYSNPATNNLGRSIIDLDTYRQDGFSLANYSIKQVMDDVIIIEYVDTDAAGRDVIRNGVVLPAAHVRTMWRIGRVLLTGPNCNTVKPGDFVTFPSDKGIAASNLKITTEDGNITVKHAVFLDEKRIFGVCVPVDENESSSIKKTSR